jgi:hypothetical protein
VSYTYSFSCPFCGGSWQFEQFASIAKDVFSGWDGVGECPLCHGTFAWVKPGTLDAERDGTPWWKVVKRRQYKPHPCLWCGRMLEGRRNFCNTQCNKKWYYRKSHPNVKRRTLIISPPNRE